MKLWEMAEWGMLHSGKQHPLDAMLDGYDSIMEDRDEEVRDIVQFDQPVTHPISGEKKSITYCVNNLWRMHSWSMERIFYWLKGLDI